MTESSSPLHVALLTPRGRGAIATIRICGDASLLDREPPRFRAANRKRMAEQSVGRIIFGHWGIDVREDVVCCRCGESTLEIHCHGGDAAVERILRDLQDLGANVVSWQELAARSTDTLDAEWRDVLSRAVTWRTSEHLLHQKDRLRTVLAGLQNIAWTPAGRQQAMTQLDDLMRWSAFGIHLTESWRIVIAGPPNVGKSSLMNALIGYDRSIVFDQPGTTRDVLTATTAFDGWPVELIDTAGLRDATQELEAEGIARAKISMAQADLVLRVVDINAEPHALPLDPREIVVAQKCDLADRWEDRLPPEAVRVSARTGAGLVELQQAMMRRLVPQVPPVDVTLPITPRQVMLLEAMRKALAADREMDYRESLVVPLQ